MLKDWNIKEITVLGFIAVIYIVLLISSPGGFWIIDEGNKYLWAENFFDSGSLELTDRAEAVSPGHGSFSPPFSVEKENGSQTSVFSPLFLIIIAPLLKLGGLKLALLIPLVSTLLLLIAVKKLANRLDLPMDWYVLLVLGVGSPFLFYSITLWEHSLAILLFIGGILAGNSSRPGLLSRMSAGLLFAVSIYIRPEMAVFSLAVWIFLLKDRGKVFAGGLAGVLILMSINYLLTHNFLPLQIVSNYGVRWAQLGFYDWSLSRLDAIYALILQGSHIWYISAILITGFLAYLLLPGALKFILPVSLLTIGIINWFDPDPFIHIGERASLLYTSPLFLLILFSRQKQDTEKKLLRTIVLSFVLLLLFIPVVRGIHFGPRTLLPMIPLAAMLVTPYITRLKEESRIFQLDALLLVILVQLVITAWGVDMLFSRRAANIVRSERILAQSRNTILTLQWWLPQEMPELYHKRNFYLADNLMDFKMLLIDFYRKGVRFFTVLTWTEQKSPLLDFLAGTPPKQIGAFAVDTDFNSMNLTGVHYAIGFDAEGAAKMADEIGVYLGQVGRLSDSEKYLRRAAKWDQGVGKYHYNLGYCLGNQGRIREAMEEMEKAYELDPDNPQISKMVKELRDKLEIKEVGR